MMGQIDKFSGWKYNFFSKFVPDLLIENIVIRIFMGLSSLMNPVLYFLRLEKMRLFVKESMKEVRGKCPVKSRSIVSQNNTVVTRNYNTLEMDRLGEM